MSLYLLSSSFYFIFALTTSREMASGPVKETLQCDNTLMKIFMNMLHRSVVYGSLCYIPDGGAT